MGQCRYARCKIAFYTFLLLLLQACGTTAKETAPQPISAWPPLPEPYYNRYTKARYELGERLFFEKRLSAGNAVSCASCHKPERAFADDVAVSPGAGNSAFGFRNSPGLLNIGYAPYLMAEGGVPTLEHFSVAPLQEAAEMNQNLALSIKKLQADTVYQRLFRAAYDTLPSIKYMARALAVYQRYLLSSGSPYDAYLAGNTNALSPQAQKGMTLFFSPRTGCSGCHSGFLFSDFGFHDIGLSIKENDPGRWRLTGVESDRNRFKTPSLRNIALTAPYMHDGRFGTLEEVLEHYRQGGQKTPNRSTLVRPLDLRPDEVQAIISFLHSLTDTVPYKKSYL
ncbi:MAG: cytochrome-c peroxidase [Flavobacteriales bacterium]